MATGSFPQYRFLEVIDDIFVNAWRKRRFYAPVIPTPAEKVYVTINSINLINSMLIEHPVSLTTDTFLILHAEDAKEVFLSIPFTYMSIDTMTINTVDDIIFPFFTAPHVPSEKYYGESSMAHKLLLYTEEVAGRISEARVNEASEMSLHIMDYFLDVNNRAGTREFLTETINPHSIRPQGIASVRLGGQSKEASRQFKYVPREDVTQTDCVITISKDDADGAQVALMGREYSNSGGMVIGETLLDFGNYGVLDVCNGLCLISQKFLFDSEKLVSLDYRTPAIPLAGIVKGSDIDCNVDLYFNSLRAVSKSGPLCKAHVFDPAGRKVGATLVTLTGRRLLPSVCGYSKIRDKENAKEISSLIFSDDNMAMLAVLVNNCPNILSQAIYTAALSEDDTRYSAEYEILKHAISQNTVRKSDLNPGHKSFIKDK